MLEAYQDTQSAVPCDHARVLPATNKRLFDTGALLHIFSLPAAET